MRRGLSARRLVGDSAVLEQGANDRCMSPLRCNCQRRLACKSRSVNESNTIVVTFGVHAIATDRKHLPRALDVAFVAGCVEREHSVREVEPLSCVVVVACTLTHGIVARVVSCSLLLTAVVDVLESASCSALCAPIDANLASMLLVSLCIMTSITTSIVTKSSAMTVNPLFG